MLFFRCKNFYPKKRKQKLHPYPIPDSVNADTAKKSGKRVSSAASLTLEASFVLPLFIAGITALLYFLLVFQTQIRIQRALTDNAFDAAGLSYFSGEAGLNKKAGDVLSASSVTAGIIKDLGRDYLDNSFIVDGAQGLKTDIIAAVGGNDSACADICVHYKMRIPFDLFKLGGLSFSSGARIHSWNGDAKSTGETAGETVYMTKSGSVYHKYRDCSYLVCAISSCDISEISAKRNESGAKYYPCEICCKEGTCQSKGQTVFFTKYGTRYHSLATCKSLDSTVYSVELEKVSGKYSLCSKCRKRSN